MISPGPAPARDMRWIPGGTFRMGSEDFYPEEGPVHEVTVDGFWMDEHQVTIAAVPPLREGDRLRHGGRAHARSARIIPRPTRSSWCRARWCSAARAGPVPLDDYTNWWCVGPRGASWRHPEGPGSDVGGREYHPVIHVAFEDAEAYAQLGGQGPADRGRMGVRCPGRPRWKPLFLGQRVRPARTDDGQHLARRVPLAEPAAGSLRGDRRRSGRSPPTATACSTWPAMPGSGPSTSTRRSTSRPRSTPAVGRPARDSTRGWPRRIGATTWANRVSNFHAGC